MTADFEDIIAYCSAEGRSIISISSPLFPRGLKELKDPPALLFCMGDTSLLANPCPVAVVGSRKAGDTAMGIAYRMGLYLSACGATVVSGGAYGIDSCAHAGAALGTGGSIAVLGGGLGAKLNGCAEYLRERSGDRFVYITELMPFTEAKRYNFPKRNRLIAALARSVAVVEAGEKSGALITAEYAAALSKNVYVASAPGEMSAGCALLAANGVPAAENAADILEKFKSGVLRRGPLYRLPFYEPEDAGREEIEFARRNCGGKGAANKTKKAPADNIYGKSITNAAATLCGDELAVYSVLGCEPVYTDEIEDRTGLDSTAIMAALTSLELCDLVRLCPGNRIEKI